MKDEQSSIAQCFHYEVDFENRKVIWAPHSTLSTNIKTCKERALPVHNVGIKVDFLCFLPICNRHWEEHQHQHELARLLGDK